MSSLLKMAFVLSLVDRLSSPAKGANSALGAIGKTAEGLTGKFSELSKKLEKASNGLQGLKSFGEKLTIGGLATGAGIGKSMQTFADLEEAQKALRTNLMDAAGRVGPEFEKLNSLAEKMGTELPGSTKDMLEMFTALREQGVQTNVILGGMGEATAKFAVIMKVPFAQAATHVAKFSEAMGIADKDAVGFMDTLQRLKSAGGVNVTDLAESFKYSGAALKALRIQGMAAGKDVSAAIGMMATSSIEGSQAGTNFAMALSRMAEIGHRLESKKIKELIGPILDAKGIKLNFFDKGGNFIGIRNMIKEMEKLKAVNPQEQLIVLSKLFGQEAARPLSVFINSGVAGFDEMNRRMAIQADMQKKINEIMSGTKSKWETMTGTMSNFAAHVGGVFAKLTNLPGILDRLNNLFGRLDVFVLEHPKIAGIIGGTVIAMASMAIVGGGLLTMLAGIGLAIPNALAGLTLLASIAPKVVWGLKAIRTGFWLLWQAITWNPVTLPLMAAVVFVGFALYQLKKHWQTITAPGFWKDLGGWLKSIPAAFFTAGANIATSLWKGIKSMAGKPVEGMKEIVQKIRNFLPFSPAKEGPLRDIHRIRLIETIAGTMKPLPMVNAMRAVTAATMLAVTPVTVMAESARAGFRPVAEMARPMTSSRADGGVQISFSPQITIQGGGNTEQIKGAVNQALSLSFTEFEGFMKRYEAQKSRTAF